MGGGLETKAKENVAPPRVLGFAFGLVPSLQHCYALSSHLQPSPTPHYTPHSHLWPQPPGTSNREQAGRNCGLASTSPPPQPSSSLHLLGEGRTQRPDLSTSLILLPLAPLPLPPWAGRGQRKQSASPAHSHSLPHFLLQEDGLLPPLPWLRTWPWCQVSPELPELEALTELTLDPSPLSISPFPCLLSLDPGPVVKFCYSGGGKIPWKEGSLGGGEHIG